MCFRNIQLLVKYSLTICREREHFVVQVPLICVTCFAKVKLDKRRYKRVNLTANSLQVYGNLTRENSEKRKIELFEK
jgi:hypothetical protein